MECKLIINLDSTWIEPVINRLFEIGLRGVEIIQEEPSGIICTYCDSPLSAKTIRDEIGPFLESMKILWPDAVPFSIEMEDLENRNWETEWKKYFRPFHVTSRLVIKPTWEDYLPIKGEKVLLIDPGMAFGTGSHETTRLALEALDRMLENGALREIDSILDVGCGSGILSIAGVLQGIPNALGLDIDPTAVHCAHENAQRNGLENACTFIRTELSEIFGSFPLIVANIDSDTLLRLGMDLKRLLAPEGRLLLTGIIDSRQQEIDQAFRELGLKFIGKFVNGPWVLFEFTAEEE